MWVKFAFGEAALRTAAIAVYKIIGTLAPTLSHSAVSVGVISIVQTTVAGTLLLAQRTNPFTSTKHILGSIAFGIGAFFGTLLPIIAFSLGGNLAVYTFLALLAIIPGALIDMFFFNEKLGLRHTFGIATALLAGWCILNMPTLRELTALPLWMWLALVNALTLAANQGCTRWIKDVNTWVKNFWGGAATMSMAAITLIWFPLPSSAGLTSLTLWSAGAGLVVIGLWSFNVLAYRSGAGIPVKNAAVNGVYLTATIIVGALIFADLIYPAQFLGILLYVLSFILLSNSAWNALVQR